MAATEIQRAVKVTYKTAWRMGQQIRKLCAEHGVTLSGIIEADETYIGGRTTNESGRFSNKTPVLGIVERGGRVLAKVDRRETHLVLNHIRNNVAKGSMIISDQFKVYRKVQKLGYTHDSINHGKKEWARGELHTNTIEGFWSQLKRSLDGTHHYVSPEYLQNYVNEFSWRYNRRNQVSLFEPLMAEAVKRG